MFTFVRIAASVTLLFLAMPTIALAHSDSTQMVGGFSSGFMHPLSGLDHVVAMIAVGLWGVFLGRPAIWVLPVVFPLVMTIGGVLGIMGIPVPQVETGIALSGLVLGLMVMLAARPPLWIAATLVGGFAIFHGHAHGMELPRAASPLIYSAGFVIATGLLHLFGISFGELSRWPSGDKIVRAGGGVIALVGVGFLFGAF